jgi:hypothetical protein
VTAVVIVCIPLADVNAAVSPHFHDLVDQVVGKMVVRLAAAQVNEGQHDEREASGMELCSRRAAGIATRVGIVNYLIWSTDRDLSRQDVATSGTAHSNLIGLVAHRVQQRIDLGHRSNQSILMPTWSIT